MNAVADTEENDAALKTCHMRGWVEVLKEMPAGEWPKDNKLPENPADIFTKVRTFYRLTDAGWFVLNRTQSWTIVAVVRVSFRPYWRLPCCL
jgi:hypothetical protein